MKKLIALLLALTMVLCLFAGCVGSNGPGTEPNNTTEGGKDSPSTSSNASTSGNEEKPEPVVYYVGPRSGGLAWNQSKEGFDAAVAELGLKNAYFIAPTTPFNTAEILELIQTAMTNNADIVMGSFQDPVVYGEIIKEMQRKGIIVADLGNWAEGCDIMVAPSYYDRGMAYCTEAADLMAEGEEMNILFLTTTAGSASNAMKEGVDAYCAEHENATLIDMQFVNGDAIQGSDVLSAALKAYPEINTVLVADATGGLGAATYVMENDLQDDLYVIVESNSADLINATLNGGADKLVNWEYYEMGYMCLKNAIDYYYGREVVAETAPDYVVITAENGEQYAADHGLDLNG